MSALSCSLRLYARNRNMKMARSPENGLESARCCLSGGFTPSRYLRPSSGREHTIV